MAKNFIIYESRNRQTGTLMRTLDLRHNECPPAVKKAAEKEMPGARYAAQCVEHGTVQLFEEHYPAGRAIAHPADTKRSPDDRENGWCAACVAHLKAEKPKVTNATSEAYVKEFRAAQRANDEKALARKAAAEAKKAAKSQPTPVESTTEQPEEVKELVEA